jgi:hypothetical protein
MKKFSRFFYRLFILCLLIFLPVSEAFAAFLFNLRSGVTDERTRIVINISSVPKYSAVISGNKLILNLDGRVSKTARTLIRGSQVRSATIEPIEKSKSRLTITFAQKVPKYKIFTVKNPERLVIDFPNTKIGGYEPSKTKKDIVMRLGQGLTYTSSKVNMGAGNVDTYVLQLSPDAPYRVSPIPGYGKQIQKGVLSQISRRSGAIALVNASYFDSDIWVVGNLVIDNKWLGAEETPRTALVIDSDDKASIIPDLAYTGTVDGAGYTASITGLNRMRLTNDLIYFNDGYDDTTDTNEFGTEVRIQNNQVVEISRKGKMPLYSGSVVLSGNGSGEAFLNRLQKGDRVIISQGLGRPDADKAKSVVGAGPLLVYNGRATVHSIKEQIPSDIAYGRAPRTGVGVRNDGTLLVVVADGRSDSSVGMTLNEFASYFVRLKANRAMNFDGGGSSEMVVNGSIMNEPSDGAERPVRVALGILKK